MIERAVAAEIPFGWVTADEAYGDNGPLRAFLEERHRLASRSVEAFAAVLWRYLWQTRDALVWKLDGHVKGRAAGLWCCVRLRLMPLAWW